MNELGSVWHVRPIWPIGKADMARLDGVLGSDPRSNGKNCWRSPTNVRLSAAGGFPSPRLPAEPELNHA